MQEHEEQEAAIAKERDEAVRKARSAEEHAASLVASAVGAAGPGRAGGTLQPSSPTARRLILPLHPVTTPPAAAEDAGTPGGGNSTPGGTAELRRKLIQVQGQLRDAHRSLRQRVQPQNILL
jgi:hypothetical protein